MDTMETTVVRFRTALAGFHKGDVTNYISQTVSANREMINQLNARIQQLQEENQELRKNAADSDYVTELEVKVTVLSAMEEENALLKNRVRQLEYKLEEAEEMALEAQLNLEEKQMQLDAAKVPAAPDLKEQELAAYRRAEEMERRVSQRTNYIAQQLDEISEHSSQSFTSAMESALNVLSVIEEQMAILQNTSKELDAAMAENLEQVKSITALFPESDA